MIKKYTKIQIKPLSVNKAWQGKRFKTKEYREFETHLMALLPKIKLYFLFPEKIGINITYGFSSKLSDIDNPTKMFIDILCKFYGFDDRIIYEMNLKKEIVKKHNEFIKFKIYSLM